MSGIDFIAQRRHAILNLIHTWLLVGGSLGLFVVCAWVFFGPDGILFAAIFGAVSLFMATRISPQIVLRMYRAEPVSRARFPAGHAILDELVRRAGLEARPALYVLPSAMMNAFAVGRRQESALCMTDKLIRSLTQRELAGVMAHEISHIRHEDVKVMAIADMVSRFTSAMSTVGLFSLFLNLPSILYGAPGQVPWLGIALLLSAPTIGGLLQMALSRAREYDADLGAVMLTGDPDGLASALAKLEQAQRRNWEGLVLPGGRIPDPSLLRSHPRTQDRIARLMALKGMPQRDAGQMPEAGRRIPVRTVRTSTVPRITPRWGRNEERRYIDHAMQLSANPIDPVIGGEAADRACCEAPMQAPRGRPRIRITRGGVYW